jgi:hypothetical protein
MSLISSETTTKANKSGNWEILQKQSCNHRNVKIVAKRKGWEQESQRGIKRERNTCARGEREKEREK